MTTTTHCLFELIPGGNWDIPTIPVHTVLSYDPADPFAIRLTFQTEREDIVWEIARDTLATGLHVQAGGGDVTVASLPDRPGHVSVELSAPDQYRALFAARADTLQAFLDRTYAVVLPGTEMDHIDLDGGLEALLNEEAAR